MHGVLGVSVQYLLQHLTHGREQQRLARRRNGAAIGVQSTWRRVRLALRLRHVPRGIRRVRVVFHAVRFCRRICTHGWKHASAEIMRHFLEYVATGVLAKLRL